MEFASVAEVGMRAVAALAPLPLPTLTKKDKRFPNDWAFSHLIADDEGLFFLWFADYGVSDSARILDCSMATCWAAHGIGNCHPQ